MERDKTKKYVNFYDNVNMNLLREKREKLLNVISEMRKDANLSSKYLIALNEISSKKYGLVWERTKS